MTPANTCPSVSADLPGPSSRTRNEMVVVPTLARGNPSLYRGGLESLLRSTIVLRMSACLVSHHGPFARAAGRVCSWQISSHRPDLLAGVVLLIAVGWRSIKRLGPAASRPSSSGWSQQSLSRERSGSRRLP